MTLFSNFKTSFSSASARLIVAAILLVTGCLIGVWDYAHQEVQDLVYDDSTHMAELDADSDAASCLANLPVEETLDINRGDTFESVLRRSGVEKNQVFAVIKAIKVAFNPKDLRTDHKLFATFKSQDNKDLIKLILKLSMESEVVVDLDDEGIFKAQLISKDLEHSYRHAEGTIQSSLYADAVKQGAHPKIIHNMIQAFSYDVDFQRGFREGDKFAMLFDYYKDPDSLAEKPGDVIYAKLHLKGQDISIYRHKHANGVIQYYNEKGEAVKKGLLMTPVDGARISSTFGRRKHPVLGYSKMHKGVDFAAPRGTPIMAAGAGKILKIGRLGSYGNYVRIRHNKTYDTAYAHMCRFAKGLKRGSSVRQGQVIGYVGCTGRATGNHLHYELLKNGKQVNPKHVKMMPANKLGGKELQRFLANKAKIDERIVALKSEDADSPTVIDGDTPNVQLASSSQRQTTSATSS